MGQALGRLTAFSFIKKRPVFLETAKDGPRKSFRKAPGHLPRQQSLSSLLVSTSTLPQPHQPGRNSFFSSIHQGRTGGAAWEHPPKVCWLETSLQGHWSFDPQPPVGVSTQWHTHTVWGLTKKQVGVSAGSPGIDTKKNHGF